MARRFSAKQTTIVRDLQRVMTKLGATSLKINSRNILDPDDVEASVTFDRAGKRYISSCNRWKNYLDNLRAAQLAIEYTWRISEAYGVELEEEDLLDRIFAALEAPLDPNILLIGDGSENWWDILGVERSANQATIINAFRALSKVHHPDVGGDPEDFVSIKRAYEEGIEERG